MIPNSESHYPCRKTNLEREHSLWTHSRNGTLWNIEPTGDRPHSALILAARITLPHFSASSLMSLPKSAGEPASAAAPKSASRAFILGSARATFISLFSLSIISGGVFFGAATPQLLASKPGAEVDVVPPQRHKLSGAQPTPVGEQDRGGVP